MIHGWVVVLPMEKAWRPRLMQKLHHLSAKLLRSTRQLQKYWDRLNPNPQLGAKRMCYFSAKLWVRVRNVPILLQLTSSAKLLHLSASKLAQCLSGRRPGWASGEHKRTRRGIPPSLCRTPARTNQANKTKDQTSPRAQRLTIFPCYCCKSLLLPPRPAPAPPS